MRACARARVRACIRASVRLCVCVCLCAVYIDIHLEDLESVGTQGRLDYRHCIHMPIRTSVHRSIHMSIRMSANILVIAARRLARRCTLCLLTTSSHCCLPTPATSSANLTSKAWNARCQTIRKQSANTRISSKSPGHSISTLGIPPVEASLQTSAQTPVASCIPTL